MTQLRPPNLTPHFDRVIGDQGFNPRMFTDHRGDEDALIWTEGELQYAREYVDLLETTELAFFVESAKCDTVAFRCYSLFRNIPGAVPPYADDELKALYWTALAIVMAQLFRWVQNKRRVLFSKSVREVEDGSESVWNGLWSSR